MPIASCSGERHAYPHSGLGLHALTERLPGSLRLHLVVACVVPSCTIQCQLAQGARPCAFLVACPSSTYSRAEGAVRRSHSLPLSYIPCRTSHLTPTTTFITVVSLDQVEEAHPQAAITITTIHAADYFISDRVGELCCLLFIFRFEPHVLQVCSPPSEYLISYE